MGSVGWGAGAWRRGTRMRVCVWGVVEPAARVSGGGRVCVCGVCACVEG